MVVMVLFTVGQGFHIGITKMGKVGEHSTGVRSDKTFSGGRGGGGGGG